MKCPACDLEMAAGVLQSGGSRGGSIMYWSQEKRLMARPGKGDMLIASKLAGGSNFPAWICPGCRLVLFNYKEGED